MKKLVEKHFNSGIDLLMILNIFYAIKVNAEKYQNVFD
jgi:hypothetical protein